MIWPVTTLGAVCEINPRLQRDHALSDDSPVSFVPMAAVNEHSASIEVKHSRRFVDVKSGYTSFRNNDVLFAKITPCMENGKVAIAKELESGHGFGSTEFHVLRAGTDVLPEWIYYFVRRQEFRSEAKRNFTGTAGQQRVPTKFMEDVQLPLPPLSEQRRLTRLLARAEGIVRLRNLARGCASSLIPALFQSTFGDPGTNPKSWPTARLGDLLSGCDYGTSKRSTSDGPGVRVLRMGNVTYAGDLDLRALKRAELEPAELNRQQLQPGDLLFNRTNSKELVGKTGIWDGRWEAVAASYFIRLRVDPDRLSPHYVWAWMNSSYMKRRLFETARGAIGQANINSRELKALLLPVPPLTLQRQFAQRIGAIRAIRTLHDEAIGSAGSVFTAVLQLAFGEAAAS